MTFDFRRLSSYPNLRNVVTEVLRSWPEHAGYCEARFRDDPPEFMERSEDLARLAVQLVGAELPQWCADYRWMCERFLDEEIYFRREDQYRLNSFEEAYREVYSDASYMSRYIHGILVSQLIWTPHARAFDFFRTDFLTRLPNGARHLEVGPGHGFFLYYASQHPAISSIEGWDVSESSIAATQKAISTFGVDPSRITLRLQDVLKAAPHPVFFDSVIISEVLEHLEQPGRALTTLNQALKPGGLIFVNFPINSPAPDHIFLMRSPREVEELVEAAGFEVVDRRLLPVTGNNIERALRKNLSVSCVLIGRKIA